MCATPHHMLQQPLLLCGACMRHVAQFWCKAAFTKPQLLHSPVAFRCCGFYIFLVTLYLSCFPVSSGDDLRTGNLEGRSGSLLKASRTGDVIQMHLYSRHQIGSTFSFSGLDQFDQVGNAFGKCAACGWQLTVSRRSITLQHAGYQPGRT